MANKKDILGQYSLSHSGIDPAVDDTYRSGMKRLREIICDKDINLDRFKTHLIIQSSNPNETSNTEGGTEGEEAGDPLSSGDDEV